MTPIAREENHTTAKIAAPMEPRKLAAPATATSTSTSTDNSTTGNKKRYQPLRQSIVVRSPASLLQGLDQLLHLPDLNLPVPLVHLGHALVGHLASANKQAPKSLLPKLARPAAAAHCRCSFSFAPSPLSSPCTPSPLPPPTRRLRSCRGEASACCVLLATIFEGTTRG